MTTRETVLADLASRQKAMRADLERFVAIPTGWNHTAGLDELRALVVDRCAKLGASSELIPGGPRPDWLYETVGAAGKKDSSAIPPAVVCRMPAPRPDLPRLLFSGHLDTVFDPHGPFQSVSIPPHATKAVGPGVADMKGGIIIALHALESLQSAGVAIGWSFIFNSDEETGSFHSEAALRAEARRHDIGIALEPALPDGGLAVERKGSGQFIIETFGKTAHAGRDFAKGVSAVYSLARVISRVEQLTNLDRGVTVNIGPLKGGEATNIVPDYAAAWGNVRFPTGADAESIAIALDALAADGAVKVRYTLARPAKPRTPGVDRLVAIAQRCARTLNQPLPVGSTGGVCDGNILQDEGLPTLDNLGVKGGGLHTHQEWVDLDSMVERAQLLALFIAEAAGSPLE